MRQIWPTRVHNALSPTSRREGGQLVFPPGDLGRYREAFGQLAPVSRIAQVQECLDIWFELGFELVRMAVRQGAVVAGVDVDVGAVETDYAASSGWRDGRRRCRARRRRARRR